MNYNNATPVSTVLKVLIHHQAEITVVNYFINKISF